MAVLDASVEAAKEELQELYTQKANFDTNVRCTYESTMADIRQRFPDIARCNEDEINQRLWFHNKEETKILLDEAIEDIDEAHCKFDGSQYAGNYGRKFSYFKNRITGEDSTYAKACQHYGFIGSP
jgi:hypothetical protein